MATPNEQDDRIAEKMSQAEVGRPTIRAFLNAVYKSARASAV